MRLNALRPSPSLFIQRHGQNNGQVDNLSNTGENQEQNQISNGKIQSGNPQESLTGLEGESSAKDPLQDPELRRQIMELQSIEDKVIAHEQAHKSVGGEFTGAASYGYTVGPDGKRYITSGEVSISVPGSGEPEDLIQAMERVKQAALAPLNPSGQDQSVAASASAKIASLRSEIARKNAVQAYGGSDQDKEVEPEDAVEIPPSEREHLDIKI